MLLIILSLKIASTCAFISGIFGSGNSGSISNVRESYIRCSTGNYVEKVRIRAGSRIDGIQIQCTNEDQWSAHAGGYGGRNNYWASSGSGFCGLDGRARTATSSIDMLCLTDTTGKRRCYGSFFHYSYDDRPFESRECSGNPGNSRGRLIGFRVLSSSRIIDLRPTWETNENIVNCPQHLQITNSAYDTVFNGYYSFHKFHNGHHMYKHNIHNVCIYYYVGWNFVNGCSTRPNRESIKSVLPDEKYGICPDDLSGDSGWRHWDDDYIYPTLQIQAVATLPLQWGNAVGYWAYISSGSGSSGGATTTWTTSLTDMSSTSHTYSITEEQAFSQTESETETHGVEVGISAKFGTGTNFFGGGLDVKYSWTHSLTESTSQTQRDAITDALARASSISNTESQTCQSVAPTFGGRWGVENNPWQLYAWEVYRASNIENVGAKMTTCEYQYQTGPCSFVPPNCPLASCLNEHCVQCIPGVEPFKSLLELQDEYPGCIDSLDIEPEGPRCAISMYDWSCCSPTSPCGLHQGDCDSNSDCTGELVCDHSFCKNNPDCPNAGFDVCVSPDRRQLSQDGKDDGLDEGSQTNRLLEGDRGVSSVRKVLYGPLKEGLNSDDIFPQEEWEIEPTSGCIQFDDEGHCTAGPLYKYCRWEDDQCVNKENIKDEDVPEGDFTYVYGSSDPF